ncbi:MAG: carboxypeptidase regulatory-like domain-containing protein [Bryobacterales bacterium]|nr:carboxypeptidase regulatory-like domain-containing protein [Bryobacterales bacterium]
MSYRVGILAGVVACLLGTVAHAVDPCVIRGNVITSGSEPLPGTQVELIDFSTGKVIVTHTDSQGRFAFEGLATGRYSVSFSLDQYATQRIGPYELLPGIPLELLVQLQTLAPPLTRAKAGLEGIALEYGLVREQIESLPVLVGSEGRTSVDKLLLMVPGMSPTTSLEIDPFSGRGAAVSANGSRRSAINYQFDGALNNSQNRITGAQAATFGPIPEAVESFRVVTHTYSAADGRNAGAIVAPVSRRGGDNWHGSLRSFWRPGMNDALESFDGSTDSINGWTGGGQIGGPLWRKRGLFFLLDAEGWGTQREHLEISNVLSEAERSGDFSAVPAFDQPIDPDTLQPYPNAQLPTTAFDPLMAKYLDTFVPRANVGTNLHRQQSTLDSSGEMLLGRLDYRRRQWSMSWSHHTFRNTVRDPLSEVLLAVPGVAEQRRQLSNNSQIYITYSPTANFTHSTGIAGQRLAIGRWQGLLDFRDVSAESVGFKFRSFGTDPGTIPDVTLLTNAGAEKLRITPFLFSEGSAQTTLQLREDVSYRRERVGLRAGVSYQRGIWPFSNTENHAGSFTFGTPATGGTRNSVANLLSGVPSGYRLQTPRSLNLRWTEWAYYGEAVLRPFRGAQITLGLRYESQPPAVDRLNRVAAFREEVESQRFPDTLSNLIFPGDPDGDLGPLPRSTVETDGKHFVPRVGLSYSPVSDNRVSRWIFGESGRSVFRASYGVFYDFGTFAGSSAAALFQATYPPFSTDNRFDFTPFSGTQGSFEAPLSKIPVLDPNAIRSQYVTYPIRVFDRNFDNAFARHWTIGWQRLLPGRVLVSGVYLGTRSEQLQRQRELNVFRRNPLLPFSFISGMRRYSLYTDIRQFESTGTSLYHAAQIRATRYLNRGLAFDVSYNWSRAHDDGSTTFGEELNTEPWALSNFDRRNTFTATWFYQLGLAPGLRNRAAWLDGWMISGTWRYRSGLPLDIRQTQDPTFSFEHVGRPDLVGEFRRLDPGENRTITLSDGRKITGRFAFDPTAFQRVEPTDFDELRPGNVGRNQFTTGGFQQWDMRVAKAVSLNEALSANVGLDFINLFNNKNWDLPFNSIDHPFFGVVRTEGLDRTLQLSVRLQF